MFWFVRRALRALRGPLRRPLEPLLWLAAAVAAKDAWALPSTGGQRSGPATPTGPKHKRARQIKSGAPLLIILAQARLDGTRWQVVPAYFGVVTCTAVSSLAKLPRVAVHPFVCRLVAVSGMFGSVMSTLSGVFAPVFPMPKPTGPYRVGKTTRLWIDKARRSWLLKTKRKLGTQPLPDNRMMMVNIWYPAVDRNGEGQGKDGEEEGNDDGINNAIDNEGNKLKQSHQPPWPDDTDARARFAELASTHTETSDKDKHSTQKHMERFERKRKNALAKGKKRRAHWLDPLLATTLAESFFLPGWVVDYFRLVKMDATEDAQVAEPPRSSGIGGSVGSGTESGTESNTGTGFPIILFSHSFTGVKEQNSALLQEIASWGHIVVAVDHPHDAALVLYPDGSTADFRGYDMPKEHEPRNWWRFRHEHARWRALDLAHALERIVEASYDQNHPLCGKVDLSRISVIGHSFGGAAAVMLAQMDPRITSVVALDPWMWPLGRESATMGCPCPLLIFEAPEFMWNRDIFCVTNGECSSLMCAATAPETVEIKGEARHGEESTSTQRPTDERTTDGLNNSSTTERLAPELSLDSSTSVSTEPASSSPHTPHTLEDPSKPAPGFVGDSVDGHAGVGFYNNEGYYYTSNPPTSPTSHKQAAYFRPQHPRNNSADNLASMTSMGSLHSQGSLRSVHSVSSVASLVSNGSGGDGEGDEHISQTSSQTRAHTRKKKPVPTAEEEAAAAVASYASGRPPRDPSSMSYLSVPPEHTSAQTTQSVTSANTPQQSAPMSAQSGIPRQAESWSNILNAVNANESDTELSTVGSWGSLNKPFRRRSFSNRNGGSISSFAGGSVASTGDHTVMQRDPSGVAFKAVLQDTMHFDFTDIAMVAPLATTLFGVVGVGGREVHDITSAATLRFLRMFNHPRDPDHSNPSAKELEKLRAKLLSTQPVANVSAAREFGFSGGNCLGIDGDDSNSASDVQKRVGSPSLPKLNLPKLKVGQMGHPVARHRGVRGVLGGGNKALNNEKVSLQKRALLREFRKSFDATHLPENWMDLDMDSEVFVGEKAGEGAYGNGTSGDAKPSGNTALNTPATREDDTSVSDDNACDPASAEVKPKIVRWMKSNEWAIPNDRPFDESQRREMRWLLHECQKLKVKIQPSDFVAMFPSFETEAIKKAALRELVSDEKHDTPKPLVWLAQMVVDGDIPRHTREGGNHHGVPDEELE